jgi:hypothetical protein
MTPFENHRYTRTKHTQLMRTTPSWAPAGRSGQYLPMAAHRQKLRSTFVYHADAMATTATAPYIHRTPEIARVKQNRSSKQVAKAQELHAHHARDLTVIAGSQVTAMVGELPEKGGISFPSSTGDRREDGGVCSSSPSCGRRECADFCCAATTGTSLHA